MRFSAKASRHIGSSGAACDAYSAAPPFRAEGASGGVLRRLPFADREGQTISQPYIVALMTERAQLKSTDRVLEIGTGSGYQAAILSQLVSEVYTIERLRDLAKGAENVLAALHYKNIFVSCGDGSLGWSEKGPFDAILVTAGAPYVPEALLKQLSLGGRLVIPVGDSFTQNLLRVTKISEKDVREELLEYVRFVPLIGEKGWG